MAISSRKKKTLKKNILILDESQTSCSESKDIAINISKKAKTWRIAVEKQQWKSLLTSSWAFSSKFIKEPLYWSPESTLHTEKILWFAGLDVHKASIVIGLYGNYIDDYTQKILGPIMSFPCTEAGYEQMFELLDYFHPIRMLMETTGVYSFPPYYLFVDRYNQQNINCVICMNACDLSRHLVLNKKTDKIDAARMSQIASMSELLKPSYIPSASEYIIRLMLRQRNKYMYDVTKYKNRIKTLFAARGFPWEFDFGNIGEMKFLQYFINQNNPIIEAIRCMEEMPSLSPLVTNALKKQKRFLLQWGQFQLTELERLNLQLMFGLKDKMEGLVEFMDKFVLEFILSTEPYQNKYQCLKDHPGFGIWTISTVILESGPMSRFLNIGTYLSYAGISKGIEDSAGTSVQKGPNSHSSHILKAAYRTVAYSILNSLVRTKNSDSLMMHPIYQYAQKIQGLNIKMAKKANKVAAKVARTVYALLRANKEYTLEMIPEELPTKKPRNKLMARYTYLNSVLMKINQEYTSIFEDSGLIDEDYIREILLQFHNLLHECDKEKLMADLKKQTNLIRNAKKTNHALKQ